ncbi:MAG: hypothetical protein AAF918_06405 [Pseudomonadota bacterium]
MNVSWEIMVIAQLGALLLGSLVAFTLRNLQLVRANRGLGGIQDELRQGLEVAEASVRTAEEAKAQAETKATELEAEVEKLKAAVAEAEDAAENAEKRIAEEFGAESPEAMRELLLTFTKQSRELHDRIQELERENQKLRDPASAASDAEAAADGTDASTTDVDDGTKGSVPASESEAEAEATEPEVET